MTPHRARPAFAELLAAQTVRRLEDGDPRYYPDIDLRLSREAPRDADGHLKNPPAVLGERAGEVLETRYGLRTGWISETIGWLNVARVVGCVAAFILAFGAAEPWMSQDQTVNVEWIFGFLTVLVVSMAITVLMMLTAALSRRKSEGADPGGAATRSLAKLLVVHWLMMFLVRRALPWIQRRIRGREKEQTPEQRRSAEKLSEAAYDTLSAQSRRIALEAAFTSNLVWLLVSLGLFLSLGKMGLFRQYDFRWQATIVSDDFMLQATRALARPIRLLPLVSVPTAEDVHWLTRGEIIPPGEKASTADERQQQAQATRQMWGRLFLAFLLYYGVLPRAVLTVIALALARRAWRGLEPRTDDPYFRQIVEWIETPPFHTTEQSPESLDEILPPAKKPARNQESGVRSQESEVRGQRSDLESDTPHSALRTPHSSDTPHSALRTQEPPLGDRVAVFSFDVPPPAAGWQGALPLARTGTVLDLGNAGSRESRRSVLDRLAADRDDVRMVVLVANLSDNPDGLFEDFCAKATAAVRPDAARALVLTGGETLRQRYEGDAGRIAARVELWRSRAEGAGVDPGKVVEFDAENATASAREAMAGRLASFLPESELGAAAGEIRFAGQFRRAAALISGYAGRDALTKDAEALRRDAVRLNEEIRTLYQKQASQLERAFKNISIDTDRIRSAVRETAGEVGGHLEKFEHLSQMSEQVAKYTKGLSARWGMAGGVLCGIGGGVLTVMAAPGVLPALVPAAVIGLKTGVLGGVLSAHAPHLAAKLGLRRGTNGTLATEAEDAGPPPTFTLDDLVRTNALWALILELQGTPEELIARTLADILGGVSEEPLTTPEEAQHWLATVTERTEEAVSTAAA